MRKNTIRTIGGGIALAVPMALGIGGVASADTSGASNDTAQHTSVTAESSGHARGDVHESNGHWFYTGWVNGQRVNDFDLTAALNLSGDNQDVYQSNGHWCFQGEENGQQVDNFDLTGVLHLGSTNGGDFNGDQYGDNDGILGLGIL